MAHKRNPRSFVENTLAKWLEWEGGARAASMEPGGGGAYRGESDSLLWNCTVGVKVEHTPKLPWDPSNPMSLMSVCEQVARLRMAETSLAGQEQQARRLHLQLQNVRGHEEIRDLAKETAEMIRAGRRWVDERLGKLLMAKEYRIGMEYLYRELTTAWRDDNTAPIRIAAAVCAERGSAELLRMLMVVDDMNALDLADLLDVSLDTVKRVLLGSKPVPERWMRELALWQGRLNGLAEELEKRRLMRMAYDAAPAVAASGQNQ
jgi:hypothetical protein